MRKLIISIIVSIIAVSSSVIRADETTSLIKSHNLRIKFDAITHKMQVVDKVVLSEDWDDNVAYIAKVEPLFVVSDVYTSDGKKIDYTYQDGKLEIPHLAGVRSFIIDYYGILNMDIQRGTFARVADSYYLLKFLDWIFTPEGMQAEKAVMEYHIPKELDIITEGQKMSETVVGDKKISTWEVEGCESWLYYMIGKWHKTTKKSDNVEIRVWLTSDKPELAAQLVDRIEGIHNLYSQIYTPYPRDTFTYLEFPNDYPAWNGFLKLVFMRESATADIVNDIAFVAHEIAHNWWPNYIYLQSDQRFLIDGETFCSFSEYLAQEFLLGSVDKQGQARHMVVFIAYPEEEHRKGRFLLHNLRLIYGDQMFFPWLKKFSEKYKRKRTSIDDFLAMAPPKEQFDLNEFLKNWQEVEALPTFKLTHEMKKIEPGDRYELIVNIYQDSDPLAQWYLPILMKSKAQQVQKIVKLIEKTTTCRFELSFEPEEVLLDPNYLVPRRVPQFQKGADVLALIDSKAFPLIFKKKDKESLPFLLRALELDDENAETHYLLGRAYKILNQQDKAKQFYSQAVSRRLGWYMGNRYTTEQLHVYSHWQLAQIFLEEKKYDLARKNLEAILQKPDIEGFHKRALEELKKLPDF